MAFKWFDAKEVTQFGESLAEFVGKKLPVTTSSNSSKMTKAEASLLHSLFDQVDQFQKTHKLNIYKKAKLGNSFKWKMLDLGYEKEFVNDLTHELMTRL